MYIASYFPLQDEATSLWRQPFFHGEGYERHHYTHNLLLDIGGGIKVVYTVKLRCTAL